MSVVLKNTLKVLLLFQLIVLVGCEKEPKDWEIVYDDYILGFHGETVSFNKPMVYVLINSSEKGYITEQINIGKKLTAKRTTRAYKGSNEFIEISDNENFDIIGSLWVRKDWWTSMFTSDWHIVVFNDSKGIKSYSLINVFKLYSTRPEFDAYLNYGQ